MAELQDLAGLQTEQSNSASSDIDQVSTVQLCRIINDQDATIATAVSGCIPVIAAAIERLAPKVHAGGRVVYVGAGTSGRLGVLDASEIPPTFSVRENQFVGIIAGGEDAIRHAQEGAEDDVAAAVQDLEALQLRGSLDSLIGIAASGRTPYVLSCLAYAKGLGCVTIGVACTEPSAMGRSGDVDFMISPVVGPEIVTGSTRMKAGTATKLVLNMLSTGVMIKSGKTYGNMMVDLKATNLKLQQRSRNILRTICGTRCPASDDGLNALLRTCDGSVKLAIVTIMLEIPVPEAKKRLDDAGGVLASVLKDPINATPAGDKGTREYVLCVDGGGSKCAAAVMSVDRHTGYGEASSCNVTDVGAEAAIASITLAIQRACDTHIRLQGKRWQSIRFSSVWIGLAGHDRKQIAEAVDQALETLFERPRGSGLTITNDIELLAIPAAEKQNANSALVIVAGTGSVAMSFKRAGEKFKCVGRSGGWGHLLGDDGSGFDIGRQGIRMAMAALDRFNNSERSSGKGLAYKPVSHTKRLIVDHFRPEAINAQNVDLLSAVLSGFPELENKKRIAQVARLVLEASKSDPEAHKIVDTAVQNLVRLLDPLTDAGQIDPQTSILVLGGGLMQNADFSSAIRDALKDRGITFKHIEVVNQPAISGAKYLLCKQQA